MGHPYLQSIDQVYKVFVGTAMGDHLHARGRCLPASPGSEEDAIMTDLANKTALVTGASRGMGRATALALAAAGARVVVHYGRNADEAKAVVDQIRAAGGRADPVAADLAATDGAHHLAAQVRNLIGEKLDIVVANAGISKSAPIEDVTVKDFDDLFAVNV